MSQIAQNLERVNIRIAEAALRAKRNPSEITLVAVSKTFLQGNVILAKTVLKKPCPKLPRSMPASPMFGWPPRRCNGI